MKLLLKIRTLLILCLSWVMYGLSFVTPRNERLWIFIGWYKNTERETFADNSKYVFLQAANHHKNIRSIWIAGDDKICEILRSHGYEAYNVHSLRGAYFSLRAGYTIVDALMQLSNWRYSGGSKTIQLWHADGIKKLNITDKWKLKDIKKIFNQPGFFKHFYFYISSSEYIRDNFVCPSFDIKKDDVRITGLPRYDVFFRDVKGSEIDMHTGLQDTLRNIRAQHPKKIVLYAPTFRRGRSVTEQLAHLNLKEMNSFLVDQNYFLIISLHPKFSASNWQPEITYSNISYLNAEYDIYPLLPQFDVLITDYSSTCIEFLLLNKPTIFYIYDIDEYRKNEGLAEKFWNHMPGPRVRTYDELIDILTRDEKELKNGSEIIRNEIFQYHDGNSSERVVQELSKTPTKP